MEDDLNLLGDQKLSEFSLLICKYPKSLHHWENLLNHLLLKASPISKSINKDLLQLVRSTYESLLYQFPFLENYHVEYGLLEYKLGNFGKFHAIFENALQYFNNRSLLIWVEYLKICNKIMPSDKQLFQKYAFAESYIGLHFFGAEFWHMYLNEIKLRCKTPQHYIRTLRKVIEIPLYEYSSFYDLWLQTIEDVKDLSQLRFYAEDKELWKKLKIDTQLNGRRGPHLQVAKKALKKVSKELFLVVQYEVMEIYELFESKITKRYYMSAEELIPHQEIIVWTKYFEYIREKKISDLIKLQFQRSVLPLAHYDHIWLQYANYLIDDLNDFIGAKNVMLQALSYVHKRSRIVTMLSSVLIRLGQISELHQLYDDISLAFSNDLTTSDDFEIFIDYIQFNLFLSSANSKSRFSGLTNNIEFSDNLLDVLMKKASKEDDHNRQYILLNMVNEMYERFPRALVETKVYQHIINSKWKSFLENPKFWYLYCSLVWYDNNITYLKRRKHIINDIIPSAAKYGKAVLSEVELFISNYLPDDMELFTEAYTNQGQMKVPI
ncbi:mRNA splicing protein PRP42 [Kluyveromyces lactis]|uniref:KLLA0C15169p n=1 Tax=Kluyveromyces lactis (strain ATCC 8585 / CBS 2359 / DSM 70799 / NBRC 1267 / NRRL Y-1140 / WM37) TaxID=284590 RepID=Q6CT59_KLULA|nr:uncharacterized protein KLLA0_C15169g [Kluyveromyces lactis]CAH01731.1 KLLA0C15169p [Kluyveromyces lactis]|eukprot:XP_452880.1 uncharacterized protein KLLA0_C15169g [Kluyveromyces lactis]